MKLSPLAPLAALVALIGLVAPAPALARQVQVRMLNKGAAGMMVFEPAYVKVAPGDTVRFVAADKGHNAESLPAMTPPGAPGFKGAINQEIEVRFTLPGLYGYHCLPHTGLGMVGLIEVGSAPNRASVAAAAEKLPTLARKRMTDLLAQVR